MNQGLFITGVALVALTAGCAVSDPSNTDTATDGEAPQSQPTSGESTEEKRAADSVYKKEIGETAGWGCQESGSPNSDCALTFAVTNIERFECELPEIQTFQPDHYLIRVDLDVTTTQALAEDTSNQLATLFLNQWSAETSDGYMKRNLDEKAGCISGVDQTGYLLPGTKTRPTAIIEIPNDTTELQLRPTGMEDGGGWAWPLNGIS